MNPFIAGMVAPDTSRERSRLTVICVAPPGSLSGSGPASRSDAVATVEVAGVVNDPKLLFTKS